MSEHHSEDWHTGHGVGYHAAEEDLFEWMTRTIWEWYNLGIVNSEQMLPLKDLVYELDKLIYPRQRGNPDVETS